MIYRDLFISFFKIGLFSFGGGYAMIPLISREIVNHSWMTQLEFIQIIGIAQMTPGPIAVNSATFVGFQTAGLLGAFIATTGVALPSLLIILFISGFFFKNSKHPLMKNVFYGIRPVITGLILAAGITIATSTLVDLDRLKVLLGFGGNIGQASQASSSAINASSMIILLIIVILNRWKKFHPLILISIAGFLGYLSQFVL